MKNFMLNVIKKSRQVLYDQRGITGLETAIVLIAFVVVASVFAFAILNTGLMASEKAKTTAVGGIVESGSALTVKGSIIAHSTSTIVGNTSTGTSTLSIVERIQIPLLSLTNEPVDLSTESLVVTYIDANQVVDLESNSSAANPGTNPGWNTKFRTGDTGPLLDVGERADFWVNLSGVSVHLTASTPFTIQIKPETGIMLEIKRTTPGEITTINNLN